MLLNLYGIRGGEEAVFKKDHIVLKRKGDPLKITRWSASAATARRGVGSRPHGSAWCC
jgi:hypothetical protein